MEILYIELFICYSIYEPPLEIEVDKEDEMRYLEEAQILIDKINNIEKALGPKPLPYIDLPRPLKDFTWIELGYSIIELHKYISNRNMVSMCLLLYISVQNCIRKKF